MSTPDAPLEGPWSAGAEPPAGPTAPPPRVRADSFDEQALMQPRRSPEPPGGLRGLVGRLRGDDDAAQEDPWAAEVARCRQRAPGGRRIAVISRKGGVGKTTSTLMLGHTLARTRQDRVIAIDGNPDAGTLGHRVARQSSATVLDALGMLDQLTGYPAARRLTSQAPSGLEVLASPGDPHASRALGGADYQLVMDAVGDHYSLVLCDTGTGILDDATQGILEAVDQIVLVSGLALDTARTAALTLDWLDEHGHSRLVSDAVVVVNAITRASRVDIGAIGRHFAQRTRSVHLVEYDRHLEEGAVTDPDALQPATQAAWLQVAAAVADGFALPSPRDLPRPARTR